ncbi:MAG TPA: DedA family protein [Burkholderiales bacterium]|nr:DedA family protein [Burkholderiales bacterium]
MDLAQLVQTWGYPFVFLGTLLEGETVLLLAGFAAHAGYLDLGWVIATAAAGGVVGEQIWFFVGRRHGEQLLARFPRLRPKAKRMRELLARHHLPVILSLRFLYGLRTVGPIAIGMSTVPWPRFAALDLVAAVVWATAVACFGYAFGSGLQMWLGNLKRVERLLALVLIAGGLALWWVRMRKSRQWGR